MDDAQLDLLADAPAAVFVLVASADSRIDRAERARYAEMLEAATGAGADTDPALARVLEAAAERAARIDELEPATARALLGRVADAADAHFDAEVSGRFRAGLMQMAQRIASASGGGLLGLGKRVDDSEHAVLVELEALLRV